MADDETKASTQDEAAEELSSQEQGAGGAKAKGGSSRLKKPLMMLMLVILQAAVAYGVAQFLILPRLPGAANAADSALAAAELEAEASERGNIIMMDDVVVNLKDEEGMRFLKVTTGLEFKEGKLEQEITDRMPELRDLLIDHLSSQEVSEVVHREGRDVVKQQLLEDFNGRLQQGDLINVYFSDFVVQ
jgi:flagellar FliL protein